MMRPAPHRNRSWADLAAPCIARQWLGANIGAIAFVGLVITGPPAFCADPLPIPPIENVDRLERWRAGVAAENAQQRMLQIVCIGDSNTEAASYVCELRRMLQGCYGERGIGYHSLGNRSPVPESPRIERQGAWDLLRDAPKQKAPPPPYFAMDGIWAQTVDPQAEVTVEFVFGSWPKSDNHLARDYNIQQRVRIHHQVGPGLGSFGVFLGDAELRRVDCRAEAAGYAVTDAFLCDGFRIAGIQGKAVLFGFDAERVFYQRGEPALRGGVLVHALGKSWGRTEEPANVEDAAYAGFFRAISPDLITILLGTNDQHNDGRVERYREWLATIIGKLQTHGPGSGILVIACPEAAQTTPGLAAKFRDAASEVAAGRDMALKQFTMDEANKVIQWDSPDTFPYRITGIDPFGYEVIALIPLSQLVLTPDRREFLLETAVVASAAPGSKPVYSRMFATRADSGAFRDTRLSARVEVSR